MGSYMPEESFCPEDRVWQGEKRSFFLRTAALMSSQGNKHLLKMGGIKFLESSVSLAIQNFHQLSPLFDGCQGELYHQALWKEN